MEEANKSNNNMEKKLKKLVFFPPWLILIGMAAIGLTSEESFLKVLNTVTGFILNNFAWLFNINVIFCLIVIITVYFSPLGKVRVGGRNARPIMKYMNWVWITLTTTIAAGILFWACAEPLFHLYSPPSSEGVDPQSKGAALFAMKTMLLEWTWLPYSLYTVATVAFAFVFYNMKKSYSLGSALVPIFGDKVLKYAPQVDTVCLFALVTGMAASLGTGTMTIAGGLENSMGFPSNSFSWGIVILVITTTFVISSASGLMNGIRILSSLNGYVFVAILVFVFLFGPTVFMLNFTVESVGAFFADLPRMALMTGEVFDDSWAKSWPIFYWCNWLAWTPVTAIFLARITYGYTIRDIIHVNFVIPSIFGTIWMGIFSSSTLFYEFNGVGLNEIMKLQGVESVVYNIFHQLPLAVFMIPFYIFIVFISFVTAADCNTTAMSALCTKNISQEDQEAPISLKVIWGVTIGLVTWILISYAGIGGIKAASNLGGFPNLFLVICVALGLMKIAKNPMKYDTFKEDYDANSNPIESERLPILDIKQPEGTSHGAN